MDWKRLGKKLLFPPVGVVIGLSILSTAGLIGVFAGGWHAGPVAYAVYGLAFYTLTIVCVFLGTALPQRYRAVKGRIYRHPWETGI